MFLSNGEREADLIIEKEDLKRTIWSLVRVACCLIIIYAVFVGGIMAVRHIDSRLDAMERRIGELRTETERVRKETIELKGELERVRQGQEEFYTLFSEATFDSTAYTLACGNGDGFTATMTRPIAVDPRVIPLGSKVWINGEGPYIAEDTGGVIRGHIVDIYVGDDPGARSRALRWGRRKVEVVWLEKGATV